jgi:hypothetical protein
MQSGSQATKGLLPQFPSSRHIEWRTFFFGMVSQPEGGMPHKLVLAEMVPGDS